MATRSGATGARPAGRVRAAEAVDLTKGIPAIVGRTFSFGQPGSFTYLGPTRRETPTE